MKNVIVHGSTLGSNFGDCLFAQLVYEACEAQKPGNVLFYENTLPIKKSAVELSDHFREAMGYDKKCGIKDIVHCGGIVFMPGGYFGETTTGIKEALLRYYKYVKLGLYAKWLKKPLAILGVEAGPLSHGFLVRGVRKVCNHASVITVRNEESKAFLESIGVKVPVEVTADAAQVVESNMVKPLPEQVKRDIQRACGDRKKLLIHCVTPIHQIQKMGEVLADGVREFLQRHDYALVFTVDQCTVSRKQEMEELARKIGHEHYYVYQYSNPQEMISLLDSVDMVITSKLHVGIVSCCLNKTVLSFPFNSNKVPRYYKQIGYGERCIPIKDVEPTAIVRMCEQYYDKPVKVSAEIREMARRNYEVLEVFLQTI